MTSDIPLLPEDVSRQFIDELVKELRPGISVESVAVAEVKNYGDADNSASVSTSTQVSIDVAFSGEGADLLPKRLLAKMPIPEGVECANPELGPLFENEVNFYQRLRPELEIETPLGLGGRYDTQSGRYFLLMEDINLRSPHVNAMVDPDDIKVVEGILDTYAKLHAAYWNSPRFSGDLSWLQSQVAGSMEDMFDHSIRDHVINELSREKYKTEFVAETGMTEAELYFGEKALKRHFATLPQTVLHGDGHINNTYTLPDGTGGLFDWQVSCRGFAMFDTSYLIQTALSVESRRKHERDLVAFYVDRLKFHGIKNAPSLDLFWMEYRRMALHSFYLGWLTAPRENYGLEVCVIGNHRTKAAFQDMETGQLVREMLK